MKDETLTETKKENMSVSDKHMYICIEDTHMHIFMSNIHEHGNEHLLAQTDTAKITENTVYTVHGLGSCFCSVFAVYASFNCMQYYIKTLLITREKTNFMIPIVYS